MCSISANNAHTPFLPLISSTSLIGTALLHSKSFISSPCSSRFWISKLHFIHRPWRSLHSFVKQNTCPFVSQQERMEWSNTKPWRDLEGWVCSEAQAFWLPIVKLYQQHRKPNIATTLCHHLEKNAPHHMILQINTSYIAIYFLGFEKLHPSCKIDFSKSSSSFVSQLQLRSLMVLMFKRPHVLSGALVCRCWEASFARVVPLAHILQNWP